MSESHFRSLIFRNFESYFDLHTKNPYLNHVMRKNFAYVKIKMQISFAVTAKLISAFIFATLIVQFLFFLNLKFPASSRPLILYSLVCVGPVQKPHCWFSSDMAHLFFLCVCGGWVRGEGGLGPGVECVNKDTNQLCNNVQLFS